MTNKERAESLMTRLGATVELVASELDEAERRGAELERAAVVAWLRAEADEYELEVGKSCADALRQAAKDIEDGTLLRDTEET